MDQVEEIRSKLGIEEVVGQYVQMKRIGRNLKALCPFHNEKTPSFIISPDKGLAYCFGCRKGGDIFAFVQEVENVDFPGALKILAEKAGVQLKQTHSPKKKEQKERILSLIQDAHAYFRQQLQNYKPALEYLQQRGYGDKEVKTLGLGYAPDSFHELTKALEAKGHSMKDMLDAGVASQKEVGDSNAYDRFRHRIIFPILDPQGKLVAFGGRTLSKDENAAKYLNSPETDYYHKGQTLYCFSTAKQSIRELDQAIVVEGYFDALTAHLKGFTNTVASLGTALTEQQIKLVGRFTKNLLFAFDADTSGQTAASRSIEIAQRLGYNVSVIRIPSGKDPDEALRTDEAEWRQAIDGAVKAMDYEFQKTFAKVDTATIDGKKTALNELIPIIQRLPSQVEQEFYLKKLALSLESSLKSVFAEMKRFKGPSFQAPAQAPQASESNVKPLQRGFSRFDYLIGLMMYHEDYTTEVEKRLKSSYLPSEDEKKLYKELLNIYNVSGSFTSFEDGEQKQRLQLLGLYAEEKYASFDDAELQREVENLCQAIRSDYKKRRLQTVRFQLAKVDEVPGTDPEVLMKEYQQLLADDF